MAFKGYGAEAWKRDRHKFSLWTKPECLRFYTKPVESLVAEDAVAGRFERYTIYHKNHSDEHYFVGFIGGEQVAVRGLLHANF
jgi:hypothetical protein